MIALFFLVALISVGNALPISDAASGAQDRDFFAENLVDCVKNKRDSYSEATKTFSGFGFNLTNYSNSYIGLLMKKYKKALFRRFTIFKIF